MGMMPVNDSILTPLLLLLLLLCGGVHVTAATAGYAVEVRAHYCCYCCTTAATAAVMLWGCGHISAAAATDDHAVGVRACHCCAHCCCYRWSCLRAVCMAACNIWLMGGRGCSGHCHFDSRSRPVTSGVPCWTHQVFRVVLNCFDPATDRSVCDPLSPPGLWTPGQHVGSSSSSTPGL